jgi:hypothetical protein
MFGRVECAPRPTRLGIAALVLLVGTTLVAGCATSKLDTAGAETQISAKLRGLYPALKVGDTSCPGHVRLGSGQSFTCTVPVSGKTVHVEVQQDDGHGKVSFRTREYLLQPPLASKYVRNATVSELAARAQVNPAELQPVDVNCGSESLVLVSQPGTFHCTVTTASGTYTELGSVSAEGKVTYSVPNPPTTTTTPAAPATPVSPPSGG